MKLSKPSEATRAYLYNVGIAVLGLLLLKGLVDGELVSSLDNLLAVILLGQARANVTTKKA